MDWSRTIVSGGWEFAGAQVLMQHFHSLEKYQLADKLFGVYDHALPMENSRLMQGFTDSFPMPISRYTFNKEDEIETAGLSVLARSDTAGVGMARCPFQEICMC